MAHSLGQSDRCRMPGDTLLLPRLGVFGACLAPLPQHAQRDLHDCRYGWLYDQRRHFEVCDRSDECRPVALRARLRGDAADRIADLAQGLLPELETAAAHERA